MSLVLRVVFSPGILPKETKEGKHKAIQMKFRATMSVKEVVEDIIKSNKLKLQPEQFVLLLPPVSQENNPLWLEENRILSSFPFQAKDIVELRRKFQAIKIRFRRATRRVLIDVTQPVKAIFPFISKRFLITDNLSDYSLFCRKNTVDAEKSIREQQLPTEYTFLLRNKKETDFEDEEDINKLEESQVTQQTEDEAEEKAIQEVPKDQTIDPENIAAKDIPNPQKAGTLNMKISRKKKFEPRWIVLKNNFLIYFKDQKDKKASGYLNLDEYKLRLFTPDEKESKSKEYLNSFELFQDIEKSDEYIFKCDNEEQLQSWMKEVEQIVGEAYSRDNVIFGAPLSKAIKPGQKIPEIVEKCITQITSKYLDVVGIFRLSGSLLTIEQYKKEFNLGKSVDLSKETDPHCICGLLKLYFREMPEPLLTFNLYDSFITAYLAPDPLRVRYLKGLIETLPGLNKDLLYYLISFLRKVNEHSKNNKMAIHNLATVFGPNLLGPPDKSTITLVQDTPQINGIVNCLIQDFDRLFAHKDVTETAVTLYDYDAVDETEISFKTGQTIKVTSKGEDGWWEGELNGKTGKFPGSYVQLEIKSKKQIFKDEMQRAKASLDQETAIVKSLESSKKKLEEEIQSLTREKQVVEDELKYLKTLLFQICKEEKVTDFAAKSEKYYGKLSTLLSTTSKLEEIGNSLQQEINAMRYNIKSTPSEGGKKGKGKLEKIESHTGIVNMKVAADLKKRAVVKQRIDDEFSDLSTLFGLLQR